MCIPGDLSPLHDFIISLDIFVISPSVPLCNLGVAMDNQLSFCMRSASTECAFDLCNWMQLHDWFSIFLNSLTQPHSFHALHRLPVAAPTKYKTLMLTYKAQKGSTLTSKDFSYPALHLTPSNFLSPVMTTEMGSKFISNYILTRLEFLGHFLNV